MRRPKVRYLAALLAAAATAAVATPALAQFVGPFGFGFGYGPFYAPPPPPYYGPPPYVVYGAPYAPYGYYAPRRVYRYGHGYYGRYHYRLRNQAYSANGSVNAEDNLGETTNGPANTAAH